MVAITSPMYIVIGKVAVLLVVSVQLQTEALSGLVVPTNIIYSELCFIIGHVNNTVSFETIHTPTFEI